MTIEQDRPVQTSLTLADGTPLAELIDRDYREVSLRVLNDPELYKLELRRLFARTWTVLAHEDEVPKPGDFVLRYIGEDEVIVSRGDDNSITVSLNVCTHRAAKVCRFEAGNAKQFQCPYHGWSFKADGKFLGAPIGRENMHGSLRSKAELGLRRARSEEYLGMIFATFDETAPTLREYLGPITWYWDLMFDRTNSGMTVLGHPSRFIINANWKSAAEQFAGDIFHTLTLHRSLQELQVTDEDNAEPAMAGVSAGWQGHFVRCFDYTEGHYISALKDKAVADLSYMDRLRIMPPPGLTPQMVDQLEARFDVGQLRTLTEYTPQVGQLFPNVGALAMPFQFPDGTPSAFFTWRVWVPKGPDHFELTTWTLVERDAPAELRDSMNLMTAASFGISGFVEADDTDTWPMQSKAARGAMGQEQKLRYQAILGENKPSDWPGPGQVYAGFPKDDSQWNFWLRYLEFMEGSPW
ncbi:MAG: Rieske 2Fe-2S domain-containing protein [Rhodococcus sp. (in: high G+C Gram-positive bacteria)]|uniref:aromatic ring-hydroxylating oxygenase subunit alpha n=1 Tax=Rhodococcus sp. TaxID=1831 RepID=UPI003BAF065D